MTLAEIESKLVEIAMNARDAEHAHQLEDLLYEKVLRAIADMDYTTELPSELAHAVLKSKRIAFGRYTA